MKTNIKLKKALENLKTNIKLKKALENLLVIAEQKLQYSINKNKEWDIEHYKKDIDFIKSELTIIVS